METHRLISAEFLLNNEDITMLRQTKGKVMFQGKEYELVEPRSWPIWIGEPQSFRCTLKEVNETRSL